MATVVAAVDLARVRQPLQAEQEQEQQEEVDILVAASRTTVKAQAGLLLTAQHLQVSQDCRVKLLVQLRSSQSSGRSLLRWQSPRRSRS